jgi:hypothetical protein
MLKTTVTDHGTDQVHPCVVTLRSLNVFHARVTNTRLSHGVIFDMCGEATQHLWRTRHVFLTKGRFMCVHVKCLGLLISGPGDEFINVTATK